MRPPGWSGLMRTAPNSTLCRLGAEHKERESAPTIDMPHAVAKLWPIGFLSSVCRVRRHRQMIENTPHQRTARLNQVFRRSRGHPGPRKRPAQRNIERALCSSTPRTLHRTKVNAGRPRQRAVTRIGQFKEPQIDPSRDDHGHDVSRLRTLTNSARDLDP